MHGCRMPKQCFITMACDLESHTILWSVTGVKLILVGK